MQYKTESIQISEIDEGSRAREVYNNIEDLIESIMNNGLIQNIAVFDKEAADDWHNHRLQAEENDRESRYLLLAGGRRLRAFKQGQIADEIPAKIFNKHLDADEIKTIELEENLQREDLTYEEELKLTSQIHRHYQSIHGKMEGTGMAKEGHSIRDTARKLNRSVGSVSEDLRLAEAMDAVPELFKGAKSKTDAKKIYKKAIKSIDEEAKAQKIREKRDQTSEDKMHRKIADRYIVNDSLKGLKSVDTSTIGLVELDPPLPIGFEDDEIYGEDFEYEASWTKDNYADKLKQHLQEAYRIMKSHSWIVVWYPIEPYHQLVFDTMQEVGFKCRSIPLVWDKKHGNSRAANYNLGNTYEVAMYGRKGDIMLNKPGRNNIFSFKKPSQKLRQHRTEKPIELYMELLETFCNKGTSICTGFAGSGNLILAAENVDMVAFGFDKSSEQKNKFDLKVYDSKPGEYSSYLKSHQVSNVN